MYIQVSFYSFAYCVCLVANKRNGLRNNVINKLNKMKRTSFNFFVATILMALGIIGQAQASAPVRGLDAGVESDSLAWRIKLTQDDGLLGEDIGDQYRYQSPLFQVPDSTGAIRFTVIETLGNNSINGYPFTAMAEFVIRDAEGNAIPYTATTNADQNVLTGNIDSDGLPALNDGDYNNFFHTIWSDRSVAPYEYHYVEFTFEKPITEFSIDIVWRKGFAGDALRATLAYITSGGYNWNGGDEGEVPGEDCDDVDVVVTAGELIDLGLSVKWASCNIGAVSPEEYGEYFQWSENDIANEVLGGYWYTPTKELAQELVDECSWEWCFLNGIRGYKVVGPNGNSIFLPAAGWMNSSMIDVGVGSEGNYWTSTFVEGISACDLQLFEDGEVFVSENAVIFGYQPIRPVYREGWSGDEEDEDGEVEPDGEETPEQIPGENGAWSIELTEADGLLGEYIDGQYRYRSSQYQLPEPTTSIRFTVVETVENMSVNGYPFTAIAEFLVYDADGKRIPYTAYANSDAYAAFGEHYDNGSGLVALSDNDFSTFYHSIWHSTDVAPDEYHYVEFAFEVPITDFSIDIVWRYGIGGERLRATLAYLTPGNSKWNGELPGGDDDDEINVTAGEVIDLGLSVKWASCNVGATSPEEYGDYFAWGETSPKSSYGSDNSVTDGLSYSELKSRGIIGSDGNLTAEYDAATANWGGNWRMPTFDELEELLNKCTWTWTTQNGVSGYIVTGRNGNSIFLPAAGCCYGTEVYDRGSDGYCWSSSLYSNDSNFAYLLYFISGSCYWSYGSHYSGLSVRPVCGEAVVPEPVASYTVSISSTGNGTVVIKDVNDTTATVVDGSKMTVVAVADAGNSFVGWFVGDSEEPVSTDAEYSFVVGADVALVARFVAPLYEAVDLGLSVKWASCNIGAASPEDYGTYFQWTGEDIANELLGGNWYMPTKEEGQELIDECEWEWCALNDVTGCRVTGPNGNSIFLPATGWSGNSVEIEGNYWTITPSEVYESGVVYDLQFHDDGRKFMDGVALAYGYQTIRAVYRDEWNEEDKPTVIEAPTTVDCDDDVMYDIRGRRLTRIVAPGIYVVNGKKVIVK